MIKKISVQQLQVGMYISNLDAGFLDHHFITTAFPVNNRQTISKVQQSGIKNVYIDTSKGIDVEDAYTIKEVHQSLEKTTHEIAHHEKPLEDQVPLQQEIEKARIIYKEASGIMHELMEDIRLGKQVEVERVAPISEQLIESVFRNKDALISLTRIKDKDHYTFMHSVSVAGLMISFARTMGYSMDRIREVSIGGLLHDAGKMMIPDELLNKPGKLTDEEFRTMQHHAVYSRELLEGKPGITQIALDIASQHHERMDGTGYPLGLIGDDISEAGQMSTIVDVYDALTSARVYKSAWEPNLALKKLLEWSDHHFNPVLVKKFIGCLGIYPIGTLVELASKNVAIVIEQGSISLLKPTVRIIFDMRKRCTVPVTDIDLTKTEDYIVKAVSPKTYQIDMAQYY